MGLGTRTVGGVRSAEDLPWLLMLHPLLVLKHSAHVSFVAFRTGPILTVRTLFGSD